MAFFLQVSKLRSVWRPTRRLDTELLRVLGVQSLPAAELEGVGADDASNGLPGEMPLEHIEADVPARGAHRDVVAVDVVPEPEPSAASAERLQLPANVASTPAVFERPRCVSPLHVCLAHER